MSLPRALCRLLLVESLATFLLVCVLHGVNNDGGLILGPVNGIPALLVPSAPPPYPSLLSPGRLFGGLRYPRAYSPARSTLPPDNRSPSAETSDA